MTDERYDDTVTTPHPRDPRLRRGQPADPLAAAVRLSMSADAMRAALTGPELDPDEPDPTDVELRELLAAAVQGGTHEPRLTAEEFAAALGCTCPMNADTGAVGLAPGCPTHGYEDDTPATVAESPPPAPSLPPAASAPAFSSERSRPRSAWRSRHDPRSLAYGVRSTMRGSAPLQQVLLPTGPVLDQSTAGATLEQQSCCTGAATVAAINTLHLLLNSRAAVFDIARAEAVYQRGQQLDEYPGEDYPGCSVTGVMSAARELGLIGGNLWCFGTRDIAQTLTGKRLPVVVGVPWSERMWETGPGGLVVVEGIGEGLGHCLTVNGITLKGPQGQPGPFFRWQNSAGESYGAGGFGYIHHRDLAALLHGQGEAAVPTLEVQAPAG